MDHNYHHLWHLSLLIISILIVSLQAAVGASETQVLIKLKASLGNTGALRGWVPDSTPCPEGTAKFNSSWDGVICSDNGGVLGLQLENMSLTGVVDVDALTGLPGLRTVSFKNNSLGGPMPEIGKLGVLRSVFLSYNQFNGEIPADAFDGMGSLWKVHLSRNDFSGPIPVSLTRVPKLLDLQLEGNRFNGQIPDFPQPGLKLDLSNNELEGPIPLGLSKMNSSVFKGNKNLCGAPLEIPCTRMPTTAPPPKNVPTTAPPPKNVPTTALPTTAPPPKKSSKISTSLLIILILIAVAVALALIGAMFILFSRRRRKTPLLDTPLTNQKKAPERNDRDLTERGPGPPEHAVSGGEKKVSADPGKLVFVRESREEFELHDLLRASAEVLGNGSFGPSYKALLMGGPAMVVKRLKDMSGVGREEFHRHMIKLGRLRHPNLLSLVAYYYRKEEKLLVSDYVPNGSLAQQLHGDRSLNRRKLNWPTRLKIVKGVANGLAYLYNEFPNQILPHGHLKSSNVLLDESFEPLLVDYALTPVINKEHAAQLMVAYKSPEYTQYGRTTKKSDVWSLGMLILEILTGKHPSSNHLQGKGGRDLASWVNSVVREEWTGEVFDSEIEGTGMALRLLQIGLGCCERDVEKRWNLTEAIERIEELGERDGEEGYSFASEGDMDYSSRGMTEEEFSFSVHA